MDTVVDNDILIKGACYELLNDLISVVSPVDDVGILGSSRFVVPPRIRKRASQRNREAALEVFSRFALRATTLEPSEDEQRMAADLELMAQRTGVALDAGESQLCAIFASRLLSFLLTGDKRAIAAIESLLDGEPRISRLAGKVICAEQLFIRLIGCEGTARSRNAVCSEPDADKALTNCFSCHSDSVSDGSCREGLESYVSDLRRQARRVLYQ